MGSKRKRQRGSNSSYPSSSDETSTDTTTPPRRSTAEAQRSTRKKEDKLIKWIFEELKDTRNEMRQRFKELIDETRKQFNELTDETTKQFKDITESQNNLCKQLELHINGLSGEDSAASRSEPNQVQPPRYRLEFTCEVKDEIEKDKIIETKPDGKMIYVVLKDDQNQIVNTGPLASAKVKLVVVNGEFNQHGNQCSWSRKEFLGNIKRPRKGNSAMGDVNKTAESIVKNCFFDLVGGVGSHGDAKILYNSSNKKVRLAAMVVSPTEERVLEGLSNPFFVRGHDRPARESKLRHERSNRQIAAPQQLSENTTMLSTEPSTTASTCIQQDHKDSHHPAMYETSMAQATNSLQVAAPQQLSENTTMLSTEPSTTASTCIQQDQDSHAAVYGTSTTNSLHVAGEQSELPSDFLLDTIWEQYNFSPRNDYFSSVNGTQSNRDYIALPVQLVWDMPIVEPRKCWNLLDQLMPLYSCQRKFSNSGLHTMHLMTERLDSLTFIPKDVTRTSRRRGVLIEPLQTEDSYEKRPVERRLHSKYTLRFVNKVCKDYYTKERIKADDGKLLKVALFDENNTKITSGPLSSASVELVVLHGDFNADGQDYWTSEDFCRCVVCPQPGKSEAVLGGDRILILAEGEVCLGDAFFKTTSFHARTGKFMMGVRLASAQDERVQEGISEPFRVTERPKPDLALPRSPMRRSPCCKEARTKTGPWTPEEDERLINYITKHGHGSWRSLPKLAGLQRCGKSCRLRWTNYLRPDVKRGKFSEEEVRLIINLHSVLGNKWATIATHLPGRTDNEIRNYWNTHIRRKLLAQGIDPVTHRPRPHHQQSFLQLLQGHLGLGVALSTSPAACSDDDDDRRSATPTSPNLSISLAPPYQPPAREDYSGSEPLKHEADPATAAGTNAAVCSCLGLQPGVECVCGGGAASSGQEHWDWDIDFLEWWAPETS
ncbi:hypothetical protein ACP4OV_002309 [Aristida adscensionis]